MSETIDGTNALMHQLIAWEAAMTSDELNRAFAFVESNGWQRGSTPPLYVWAAAYNHVAPDKRPEVPA